MAKWSFEPGHTAAEFFALVVRKSLKLQRVIGGPWRIRTSNQRIMSPLLCR